MIFVLGRGTLYTNAQYVTHPLLAQLGVRAIVGLCRLGISRGCLVLAYVVQRIMDLCNPYNTVIFSSSFGINIHST